MCVCMCVGGCVSPSYLLFFMLECCFIVFVHCIDFLIIVSM